MSIQSLVGQYSFNRKGFKEINALRLFDCYHLVEEKHCL